MVTVIPEKFKDLWDEWNLRCAVLLSLSLQVFLVLFASSRKRRGVGKVSILVWVAYLLADWVAAFAVGLISSGLTSDCPNGFSVNKNLAAFWAPFLLLHLGGPDSITAFSLEDNELWIRHLFGLLIQLVAVGYVILQSLPNDFWIPTLLMLIAGTIKYAERTRSLYVACLENFKDNLLPKPDAGPNYAQLMDEYSSREAANVPVKIVIVTETDKSSPAKSDHKGTSSQKTRETSNVTQQAFKFYKMFKGIIVDHMLSFEVRNQSRNFFFARDAEEAFRVMEVELNFMYDELYTKMAVVHHTMWHLLRIVCSALVVVALHHFAFHHKHKIDKFDIGVTYTLLIGALALDIISHFNLIFSDWTMAAIEKFQVLAFVLSLHERLSSKKRRRWSNTIYQHSLIYYCLDKRFKWIQKVAECFGIKSLLDEWIYKRREPLEAEVKEFIFQELKRKAKDADIIKSAKEICSERGELTLLDYPCQFGCKIIQESVSEGVEFDQSLLMWHIATELCYYTTIDDANPDRIMCKLLSEYMLYLLIMQPTLMSAVAGIGQVRFQDTCEEARRFFNRSEPGWNHSGTSPLALTWNFKEYILDKFKNWFKRSPSDLVKVHINACSKLFNVATVVKPSEVKGDRSKSVLFDACSLAKELQELDVRKRWEMMSRVWVELLCYAATHCRPSAHAQQISKGGQLITFVWLLMTHFGLGEQFRIEAGHARAKLIVSR